MASTKDYSKFDKKVESSKGTSGTKKIKILLDASKIYPRV